MAALKSHPWFAGLDWKHVLAKRYAPPYVPRVAGRSDTSNFDDFSQLPPMQHPFKLTVPQQALFACF
jgi:serum/glucocorticoid-regulated kinase 2